MKKEDKEELIKRFEKNQKDAFDFYKDEILRMGLNLTQRGFDRQED